MASGLKATPVGFAPTMMAVPGVFDDTVIGVTVVDNWFDWGVKHGLAMPR